jgi:hypothetical protein
MSSDRYFSIFGKVVLVLVILGVVGFGAYYLGTKQGNQNQAAVNPGQTSKSANQTSAIPTQETSITSTTPAPTIDETAILIAVIKDALVTEHGSDANALNITVSKIKGDYASGDASTQGGGGIWFATKVNGTWKLVWDGNGSIQCSSLAAYPNFPTDMIPECWNDKTQAVVKR